MRTLAQSALVLIAVGAARLAHADSHEIRLSLEPRATLVTVDAYRTTDSALAYGGALAASYGISDGLEVGVDGAYLVRPTIELSDAATSDAGGAGFRLFADMHVAQVGGHARLFVGPNPQLRAVLVGHAGVGYRILSNAQLADANNVGSAVDGESTVFPYLGADAGVVYRLTDGFQLGLMASTTWAADHRTLGAHLELSWFSFDWL